MFFRGYVETKDKQCVEKFKGRTDFKTYEQVKSLPEFAGILAEDTILVDLDDDEFCIKNNFRPVNRLTFSKQLNQALGTTVKNMRLNGKQCKVFVEQ